MCMLSLSAAGSPITVGMSLKLRASVRSALCVFDRQPGDLPADVCVFVRVRVCQSGSVLVQSGCSSWR